MTAAPAPAQETLQILRQSSAIIENIHIVHISGRHFPMTINKGRHLSALRDDSRITWHFSS